MAKQKEFQERYITIRKYYTQFHPQSWRDYRNAYLQPTIYLPYSRRYSTLTTDELRELIQLARRLRWVALDLRSCGLSSLPDELGDLPDLRVLLLGNRAEYYGWTKDDNTFTSFPESMKGLANLEVLSFWGVNIREIPGCIKNLKNLRALDFFDTEIRKLPAWIRKMNNLKTLSLSGTEVSQLPDSIGQLTNLQWLNLSRTYICEIPDSIARMKELQVLSLSSCHLHSIPYSLVKLGLPFVTNDGKAQTQNFINLTGVTLDEGDLSLFDQPREVIEAYYRNRMSEAEAEKRVSECKVIFLGDGAAGKSSLIERMVKGTFKPGTLPTDGVKMTKWSEYANGAPLTLDGKPLTIRFLDFGGQEIMHSMHRCFLTTHTVYVVVCESRDDAEIDNVAIRWMETVKSFAPDCPILLVLNKVDMNPHVTINERTLRASNPKYLHTLHTSAKTGQGVRQLIEDILREVPGCLQKMNGNRGWMGLKQELEDMEKDYILPEKFRERCDHFQIREDLREKVLNWFQDLGVAYPYSNAFQEMYVLNPEWLTNGIYRLILRTPSGGFLKHSTIRKTLAKSFSGDMSEKMYTPQEMAFILHIMRKFEISLYLPPALGNGEEMEMIPMKMDKTPPKRYDEFPKSGALHLRWEAGYLPNNLIHRLMIRKYAELDPDRAPEDKCVWRTGGWFRSTDGGWEALAELTDRALDVYVRGARDARIYMDSFRQQIRQILRDLNIAAKEWIYCTVNGKEGRIPYSHVTNLRNRDIKEIYLGDIDEFVSVATLLDTNYVAAGEEPRDFFISYNNTCDGARAAWIARTLIENGYTVHFQGTDCLSGSRFAQWMADAIAHSRGVLAVWSSAYEASSYCKDELNAAYVRSHKDSQYFLLPVRVEDTPVKNPLFQEVVRVDLLSRDAGENRKKLLKAVEPIRWTR